MDEGWETYDIIGGRGGGSVLGPLLWNVMYAGILLLPVAKPNVVAGFEDDVGMVIASKQSEEVEIYANETPVEIAVFAVSSMYFHNSIHRCPCFTTKLL